METDKESLSYYSFCLKKERIMKWLVKLRSVSWLKKVTISSEVHFSSKYKCIPQTDKKLLFYDVICSLSCSGFERRMMNIVNIVKNALKNSFL